MAAVREEIYYQPKYIEKEQESLQFVATQRHLKSGPTSTRGAAATEIIIGRDTRDSLSCRTRAGARL
jgi:hypothetical protein